MLDDARFVSAETCSDRLDPPVHVQGLGAGDHATPAAARSRFELPAGDYCGLQLPLVRSSVAELPAAAPPELAGQSVLLKGETAAGTPFRITSALDMVWFVGGSGRAFRLDEDTARVLVAFDVGQWLRDLDLDGATPDAAGWITISADADPERLAQFEANLSSGVALYRDPAGAGTVDGAGEQLARSQ